MRAALVRTLLERNPIFIQECREIQKRMEQGDYLTHEQVLAALEEHE